MVPAALRARGCARKPAPQSFGRIATFAASAAPSRRERGTRSGSAANGVTDGAGDGSPPAAGPFPDAEAEGADDPDAFPPGAAARSVAPALQPPSSTTAAAPEATALDRQPPLRPADLSSMTAPSTPHPRM